MQGVVGTVWQAQAVAKYNQVLQKFTLSLDRYSADDLFTPEIIDVDDIRLYIDCEINEVKGYLDSTNGNFNV